jgi:hypothetical protein
MLLRCVATVSSPLQCKPVDTVIFITRDKGADILWIMKTFLQRIVGNEEPHEDVQQASVLVAQKLVVYDCGSPPLSEHSDIVRFMLGETDSDPGKERPYERITN